MRAIELSDNLGLRLTTEITSFHQMATIEEGNILYTKIQLGSNLQKFSAWVPQTNSIFNNFLFMTLRRVELRFHP